MPNREMSNSKTADDIKFMADVMLGKLAKWMRVLGWDVRYENDISDSRLLREAEKEGRVVLTRDRRMVEEWKLKDYLFVESDTPAVQLREVVSRYGTPRRTNPLERCLVCNVVLDRRNHKDIEGDVPEYVFKAHNRFSSCPRCGRVYWRGTHYEKMRERISAILEGVRAEEDGRKDVRENR